MNEYGVPVRRLDPGVSADDEKDQERWRKDLRERNKFIIEMHKKGITQVALAAQFNLTQPRISQILHGE